MNLTIPETDNETVAQIAAALALLESSREFRDLQDGYLPLDNLLELFDKAYKGVLSASKKPRPTPTLAGGGASRK